MTELYKKMTIAKKEMDEVSKILKEEKYNFTHEQIAKYHRFLIRHFAAAYSIDIAYLEIIQKPKTKKLVYQFFIAKADGTYPVIAHVNKKFSFDEYLKDTKYYFIYHHRYICVYDNAETTDEDTRKKFKLLTIGDINKTKFLFVDAKERNFDPRNKVDHTPYIIEKTNFYKVGIICDEMNKKINRKKENELINSCFTKSQAIEHKIYNVYRDGNCCFYLLYIILKLKNKGSEYGNDPKIFIPIIQKHLKEYYVHQLSDETKSRLFMMDENALSNEKLKELQKLGDEFYKHHMDIQTMVRWDKEDIKEDLRLLHQDSISYMPHNTPKLNIENSEGDFFQTIMPESLFVIKIFAMKYKIEVPVLNIRNTFPPDDVDILFEINDLQLFIFKSDGDPEIIKKKNYDLNELHERFNFLLVIYNNLSMNEEENAIDTSIDNKFNGIHLKIVISRKRHI